MSLLAPFYLLLAGAAAVPLLLHLLRRNISARVEFPAARYLQRAEREHSRSLRLRNLLLMLLRVLLVLALALAATRPFVRGLGAGHGVTAAAIVLDNSLSTTAMSGGSPLFERLRSGARLVLLAATPDDKLWLATADGRLQAGTRAALLAELDRVAPIEGAGDLPLALRRAVAAVMNAGIPQQVVAVATDGQRTAWDSATRVSVPVALLEPPGEPPRNRAVLSVTAEPTRWTPRGAIVARVDAPDSVGYRVLLHDRTLARGMAGRGEPIAVRISPSERGWQTGRVEIEPDDFPADDVRHFAVWIGTPPVVTSTPSAGAFVATALAALVADGRAALGPDIAVTSADAASALPSLLLPPADPVRIGAANRALARLGVPWRYGTLDRSPTVMRGIRLDGVTVSERYHLTRDGSAASDTLATAGGEPWLVAGAGYVLVASRLDPAATNLPLRAIFVPWLADLLGQRLAAPVGDLGIPLNATPGSAIALPTGADALERDDGARRSVSGASVNAPAERGVWFILRGGRRIGALVVEAPARESDLARFTPELLARRLGARARLARTPEALARETFAVGSQHPMVTPVLILAILLLAAESIAARASRSVAA